MSEAFLDSAQLRNSVLSHAKELNYLPRSVRSPKARIKVSFEATAENAPYIIPKGKPFSTVVKNSSYVYTNPEAIIVTSTNTSFSFTTDIYEGVYVQDAYTYLSGIEAQKFKLTNPNVDTQSIEVTIYEDNDQVGETFSHSTTLLDVDYRSKVYFLQPTDSGHYEIYFGDNNIGRKPKDNAIISIEYRITSGPASNGAKRFSCDFDPTSRNELTSDITVDLLENSKDGANQETLDSIKYYAPKHFQVQERAIVESDYEVSLKTKFPEINAVYAYGGETIDPPLFGHVIIAVDISDVSGFPDAKKREYFNFIKRRSPFSITPVFVEPEFSYLSVRTKAKYNINVTANPREIIKTSILNAIMAYHNENLNDFNVVLRYSKFASSIDNADPSIISSSTSICLYKKISPILGERQNINLNFNTSLRDDIPEKEKTHKNTDIKTLYSSVFQYNGEQCILEDDGSGKIRIVKIKGDDNEKIIDIGTINYETGNVQISNILIEQFNGDYIKIYVYTKESDIEVKQNTILTIENDEIEIEVEEVRL